MLTNQCTLWKLRVQVQPLLPGEPSSTKINTLRTSFYGCQKVPYKFPKEANNQQSYPDMSPMNHKNDQHDTIILRVQ